MLEISPPRKFEYDENKSRSNKVKHGIDFKEAKALWDDWRAVHAKFRYEDEPRYLVVGVIAGKHWTAICTDRGDAVRIISVRRSRKNEEELYDQANKR